jgi:hypothetical protein
MVEDGGNEMSPSRIRKLATALLLWLSAGAGGCGDDGLVVVSFHTGVVVGDVDCSSGGGSFDFVDQQGLTLLVIITDDTNIILANGNFGTCSDLRGSSAVDVRGPEDGGTIRAETIEVRV